MNSYVLRVRPALTFVDSGVALRNCPDVTYLSTESWELQLAAARSKPAMWPIQPAPSARRLHHAPSHQSATTSAGTISPASARWTHVDTRLVGRACLSASA